MQKVLAFPIALLKGHASFNRRPWHPGAPRITIEDRLVGLYHRLRGTN